MKKLLLIFCVFNLFNLVIAQQQITNLISHEGDKSSYPSSFVVFKEILFFNAFSVNSGLEIWVKKGHDQAAQLLKDINPGKGYSVVSYLVNSSVIIDDIMYFIASDGTSDGELWKTDGTEKGTVKITNFLNAKIQRLTAVGKDIYFVIKEDNLLQVWKSDGTSDGTIMVKGDISIMNDVSYEGKCNDVFIFTIQANGFNESRVWRCDGTYAGTFALTDDIDGNGAGQGGTSALTQYIEYKNELYFVSRYYLYKTDGTVANTIKIKELRHSSIRLIDFAEVNELNGKLYFSFFEADYNHLFIWESDGSEMGTKLVYDHYAGNYFVPSNTTIINEQLIFTVGNEAGGTSLAKMNLSDYSVSELSELFETIEEPSFYDRRLSTIVISLLNNGKCFCGCALKESGRKGLVVDLTTNVVDNVAALNNVVSLFEYDNWYFASKESGDRGKELWITDGTESNTKLADNINTTKYGLRSKFLLTVNDKLIFLGDDGITGNEPWCYNGSDVTMLKDINEGRKTSIHSDYVINNNEIYFSAKHALYGWEIWKTDGTSDNTVLTTEIIEGTGTAKPEFLTSFKEQVYFIAFKDDTYHLCRLTDSGTEFIYDLGVNSHDWRFSVSEMCVSGDVLYFAVEGDGVDLWISDGTTGGTRKVMDFYECSQLKNVAGKLFFTIKESFNGSSYLYVTDGTTEGTQKLSDPSNRFPIDADDLTAVGEVLYFSANNTEYGREAWLSDGTVSGTKLIKDINNGTESAIQNAGFCALNGEVLFAANNGSSGYELWKTDGTESGTKIVKDINGGELSSVPQELKVIDNQVFFQAYESNGGTEPWVTDGTKEGTRLVADIEPGILGSSPTRFIQVGNAVFFYATTEAAGRQIWKVNLSEVPLNVPEEHAHTLIYPNPCVDIIKIKTNEHIDYIEVYNQNGQLVSSDGATDGEVSMSHLKQGIYFVKVKTGEQVIVEKVLKIK